MAEVDGYGARFSQGLVGGLLLLAFALETPIIVPIVAGILAIGAVFGLRYAPFGILYRTAVRPLVGPGPTESAAPKRFAKTMGATFLSLSSLGLFFTGGLARLAIGWGFAFLVSALALLAAITDFCLACRMYPLVQRVAGGPEPADA